MVSIDIMRQSIDLAWSHEQFLITPHIATVRHRTIFFRMSFGCADLSFVAFCYKGISCNRERVNSRYASTTEYDVTGQRESEESDRTVIELHQFTEPNERTLRNNLVLLLY